MGLAWVHVGAEAADLQMQIRRSAALAPTLWALTQAPVGAEATDLHNKALKTHGQAPNQGQSLSSAIRKTRFSIRRLFRITERRKIHQPPVG